MTVGAVDCAPTSLDAMRRRFFVERFGDGIAALEGETAHHVGHVLRGEKGQVYELSDGRDVWLAKIEKVSRDRIEFALVEKISSHEPRLEIVLLLSIVKFDAMEWTLEKAAELGVSRVMPLVAERSEKGLVAAATKRAERWKKILLGAAEQSRRLRAPSLDAPAKSAKAFALAQAETKVLLSERPGAASLRSVLRETSSKSIALAIGPEGGWTDAEFVAAEKAGFREASMGELILRTETAVVAALANVNYALQVEADKKSA
jgi:16S rRNA (uracil1498-N3)-methyltransferase